MIAYKTKIKPQGEQVVIQLPKELQTSELEIFIIPIRSTEKQKNRDKLLSFPTLTDEELQIFDEINQKFNQWKINQF